MNRIEKTCRENPELTAREIAEICGVSRPRVYQVLKSAGLRPATVDRRANHEQRKPPAYWKVMKSGSRMTSSFRGDISEMYVAYSLLRAGYHVYRSMTGNAPFDLLAYSDEASFRVEVKTGSIGPDGLQFSAPANRSFDLLAIVNLETEEVTFRPPLP